MANGAHAALPPGPRTPGLVQAIRWGLRYPEFTGAAHARFGPTFTLRPGTMDPIVVTSDRDAARRLFTGDPLAKHHGNEAVRPLVGDASVFLLDPPQHLERRKLLLPPFHGERVRAYADLMATLIDRELEGWMPGDTVAVLPIAQNLTIEVILDAVLGVRDEGMRTSLRRLTDDVFLYPFGPLARRRRKAAASVRVPARPLREAGAFLTSLFTPAVATYFPELKIRGWRNPLTLHWWTLRDRMVGLLADQIDATEADPRLAERDDILAMLVQARDEEGAGLSREALQEDLVGLIAAGHETTAAAIAWGASLLAQNPEVRARAESAARDGDDDYLAALVKEVLRIRSPIPVAAGRRLEEPFEIGPHTVPAGTTILIDCWGLHHDSELWPEPGRFLPERFLEASPEPYSWLPFGGGAHRCLGSALAELEIKVALRAILRRTRVEPAEPHLAPIARRGITFVPAGGGRIRVGATA